MMCVKLRTNNPAQVISTNATEIWAMTIALRKLRFGNFPPKPLVPPSLILRESAVPVDRNAGIKPKTIAVLN